MDSRDPVPESDTFAADHMQLTHSKFSAHEDIISQQSGASLNFSIRICLHSVTPTGTKFPRGARGLIQASRGRILHLFSCT